MATEATETAPVGTEPQAQVQQGEPNNPDPAVNTTMQTDDGDGGDGGQRSIDKLPKWAQGLIKDTRAEAAKYRTRAKEIEEQKRLEQLSEDDRRIEEAVNAKTQELTSQFEQRLVTAEAQRALSEANIINPQRSLRLLDLDNVSVDDDGNIKGLDKEIEQLKEDFPNLVQGANTNPEVHTTGDSTGKSVDMNDVLRRMAGRA